MGSNFCKDVDTHDLLLDPTERTNLYDYTPSKWPNDQYLMKLLAKSSVAPEQKKTQPHKHKFYDRYYWGGWAHGKPYGKGIFYETQPDKIMYYEGEVDGAASGIGKIDFNRGEWIYEGRVNEGKAHGNGKMINNKQHYSFNGDWSNSRPVKGKLILHKLPKQNKNTGYVEIDYDQNKIQNTIKYPDGRIYVGEIDRKRYIPHGTGKVTFKDKQEYIGQWQQGEMHGLGKHQWPDGSCYSGQYMFGKKHGNGKFVFSDGKYYNGKWADGLQNGYGTLYSKSGQVLQKGLWRQGVLA